jgi:hypothetical protein
VRVDREPTHGVRARRWLHQRLSQLGRCGRLIRSQWIRICSITGVPHPPFCSGWGKCVDELLVLSGSHDSDGRISDGSGCTGRLCGGGCFKVLWRCAVCSAWQVIELLLCWCGIMYHKHVASAEREQASKWKTSDKIPKITIYHVWLFIHCNCYLADY